jgi:formylglycine-generating enzyme required for sulfatase activity
VSWNDAKKYVTWLSRTTGKSYRLLSEAEWEYAARAGTTTPFSTGDTIATDRANFNGDFVYGRGARGDNRDRTVNVGSFRPNVWGLHDMHGNVWEWTDDCWNADYRGAPVDGSARVVGDCKFRVHRGGSWNSSPELLRSANRDRDRTDERFNNLGFRVVRTVVDQ